MTERVCDEPGCERPHHSGGYCPTHYRRRRRRASPNWVGPRTILERFAAKSTQTGDCLIYRTDCGVRANKVRRTAWIERHGEVPVSMLVFNSCGNRGCWADAHSRLGTYQDMHDAMKGRGHRPPLRAECTRGHAFDEANTYVAPNGKRQCRACQRRIVYAYRLRLKQRHAA